MVSEVRPTATGHLSDKPGQWLVTVYRQEMATVARLAKTGAGTCSKKHFLRKKNTLRCRHRPECIAAAVQAVRNLFNPLLDRTSSGLRLSKLPWNMQQSVRLR